MDAWGKINFRLQNKDGRERERADIAIRDIAESKVRCGKVVVARERIIWVNGEPVASAARDRDTRVIHCGLVGRALEV